MAKQMELRKLVYLSIFLLTVVDGAITQRPLNVATNYGGQAVFNCTSDIAGAITWSYSHDCSTGGSVTLTGNYCKINTAFATEVGTEKLSEFVCNLIVLNAGPEGCYACDDEFFGTGKLYQAMLIFIGPNAIITTNSTELLAEEDVKITISVSYRGPIILPPPLPPSFYWTSKTNTSQNITSYPGLTTSTSASSYIVVSYIVVPTSTPKVPSYVCNLFFNSPNYNDTSCADNVPTYRTSWETPNYNISYPPENLNISGNFSSCLSDPVVLTCSASGYPTPAYKWFNLTSGDVISESNTVIIQRSGSYQCIASNTIRNVNYNAFEVVNVDDCLVIGAIIQKPLNMATQVGGETFFNCSSNTTDVITWLYGTDFNTATSTSLTVSNCQIGSNYNTHYRTEKTGFTCNLIVFDAMLSHGGIYTCGDGLGAGNTFQAILIIVDPNAIITTNTTELIPGEGVMISNKVSYRGPSIPQQLPPLPPSFNWTLQSVPNQTVTSYAGLTTNTSASSYILVTAQPPDVPPYLCNLFFNSPIYVPPSCAVNAPTYRTSWETPNYNVLYNHSPNITEIPYFESTICEAKVLSCQPIAYPQAETYWMDLQQNVNIYQPSITAEYRDEYLCVATNVYRNTSYIASSSYSLEDRGQFTQTPCQFAESDKVEIILPDEARCDNFTCTCRCCTEPILKCYAPTLPEAEYKWLFEDTETEGPTIKPTTDGNYTCIAFNTVNNQRFTGNKTISISHFYEFPSTFPATDETAVIVLSVFLAISMTVIIGLITWIVLWLLPKIRAISGSKMPTDVYEGEMLAIPLPEPSPYETLQQSPASVYQELTLRHTPDEDSSVR